MSSERVIVVGAGLAGLAAARTLEQAGFPTTVLESEGSAGGRLRGALLDGGRVEPALATVPARADALESLEKGARERIRLIPLERVELWSRGRTRPLDLVRAGRLGSVPGLSPLEAARMRRVRALRRRFEARLDASRPERVGSLDDRSVDELCSLYLGDRLRCRAYSPLLETHFGLETADTSRAALLLLLGPDGGPAVKLALGLSGLVEELASGLKDLRLRCPVASVARDGRSVELGSGQKIGAEAVILAVPPSEARRIVPEPSAREQLFLECCSYAPRWVLVVAGKGGAATAPSVCWSPASEGGPLAGALSLPPLAAGEPPHALLVARPGWGHLGEAALAPALREAGARLLGESLEGAPARLFEIPRFASRFPVGHYRALERFRELCERELPRRRLTLCGDYLAGPHPEAAASSGVRAASEIVALLGGERAPRS